MNMESFLSADVCTGFTYCIYNTKYQIIPPLEEVKIQQGRPRSRYPAELDVTLVCTVEQWRQHLTDTDLRPAVNTAAHICCSATLKSKLTSQIKWSNETQQFWMFIKIRKTEHTIRKIDTCWVGNTSRAATCFLQHSNRVQALTWTQRIRVKSLPLKDICAQS